MLSFLKKGDTIKEGTLFKDIRYVIIYDAMAKKTILIIEGIQIEGE